MHAIWGASQRASQGGAHAVTMRSPVHKEFAAGHVTEALASAISKEKHPIFLLICKK